MDVQQYSDGLERDMDSMAALLKAAEENAVQKVGFPGSKVFNFFALCRLLCFVWTITRWFGLLKDPEA